MFSIVWIALAFAIGRGSPVVGAVLLVVYPAWDALANGADAMRSGGLVRNPSQAFNLVVSVVTAIAVAIALGSGMAAVLVVFGIWAMFSGLLQLVTGVRRWKTTGAQWAMILSGAQSVLAGTHFLAKSRGPEFGDVTTVAPYAAFGAFYFLVSAISLTVAARRRATA